MATIENKLLRGTIGPVSASSWKGINYIKAKPRRRNFDDCSERELGNRKSFAAVNKLARSAQFLLIEPIWNVAINEKMSGHNWFVKQNKRAYNSEGKLIDPRMLKLTIGNLPLPLDINMTCRKEGNTIAEISWKNPPLIDPWYDSDQLICILFINGRPHELIETEFVRKDQKAEVELHLMEDRQSSVFVFFRNEEGSKFSDSFGMLV